MKKKNGCNWCNAQICAALRESSVEIFRRNNQQLILKLSWAGQKSVTNNWEQRRENGKGNQRISNGSCRLTLSSFLPLVFTFSPTVDCQTGETKILKKPTPTRLEHTLPVATDSEHTQHPKAEEHVPIHCSDHSMVDDSKQRHCWTHPHSVIITGAASGAGGFTRFVYHVSSLLGSSFCSSAAAQSEPWTNFRAPQLRMNQLNVDCWI